MTIRSLMLFLSTVAAGASGTAALAAVASKRRLSPDLPWHA